MASTIADNHQSIIEPIINNVDEQETIDPSEQEQPHTSSEPIVIGSCDTATIVTLQRSSIIERCSGIIYAILAAIIFTGSVFFTKQLHVELLDALIVRLLVQTIGLFIYMKYIKHYSFYRQATKNEVVLLLINLFSSTSGFLSFFLAYRYLPLSDLTTIRYTQVMWTAIISLVIYREKASIPMLTAVLLTTVGVVLVVQPDFLFQTRSNTTNIVNTSSTVRHTFHSRVIGIVMALYCSIAMTAIVLSNKHLLLTYKTKHSLIMLQFTFVTLCLIMLNLISRYCFYSTSNHSWQDDFLTWRYLISSLVGLLQILSSILTQKAIKREHPSIFTIVQSSDILFSLVLQNIFTTNSSNILSICGSMLVLASLLIVGGSKFFERRRSTIE
jgi:drug/metabolite transporter (DMT)-like permease